MGLTRLVSVISFGDVVMLLQISILVGTLQQRDSDGADQSVSETRSSWPGGSRQLPFGQDVFSHSYFEIPGPGLELMAMFVANKWYEYFCCQACVLSETVHPVLSINSSNNGADVLVVASAEQQQ